MLLIKTIILNNKSCKKIIIEPSTKVPEILIGINDCGKSTILKSLEVFFDEKKSLYFSREDQEKSDLSNTPLEVFEFNKTLTENGYPTFREYDGDVISVLCEFELEDSDLLNSEFQESSKNLHLKWSIGDSRKIAILRVFHNGRSGALDLSGYYLLTYDYEKEGIFINAWNKNKTELKEIRKDLNIADIDVNNQNGKGPFKNIEEIQAIYKKVDHDLKQGWFLYSDFSKDKSFFPSFKYLDWNFNLKDLEDIATEAMNEVTSPLLLEIKNLAILKQTQAISEVNIKFEELMGDLKKDLPGNIKKISSSVFFGVSQKITDIKLQKENVDGEIHIDNQGDGIKRQIWFALLKWRSKIISENNLGNKYIWCFDEPETHLYPAAQRQLFNTFRQMCENEFQILLSTHSTVFIDRTKISDINKVTLENGYSVVSKMASVNDVFDSLGLQNSDFLFFDKFLAVEGPTEYELIPKLYKLKYNRTLIEDGIQLINLKGSSQCKNYKNILENMLIDFKKTTDDTFYLLDKDISVTGNNIYSVGIFDLEDAIPLNVWVKYLKDNCDIEITEELLSINVLNKISNNQNNKFYKLLTDYVFNNYNKKLPSKGTESGSLLANCFTDYNEVPKVINTLFESLNSHE